MLCGHCGTAINEGFATCPACGAMYRQRPNAPATFVTLVGFAMLGGALIRLPFSQASADETWTAVAIGIAGLLIMVAGWRWRSRTPFAWYRRMP